MKQNYCLYSQNFLAIYSLRSQWRQIQRQIKIWMTDCNPDGRYMHICIKTLSFYFFHVHSNSVGTLSSNFVNHLTTRANSLSNVYTPLYSETAWIEGSNIFGNNFQIFCVWDGLTVIVCKHFCSVQEMVWLRSSCGRKWIVAHACIWPLLTTIYL